MAFTKEQLKSFRSDFELATKELSKKYGVKIQIGNITYNETSFTSRLTVEQIDGTTGDKKIDLKKFDLYKQLLGLNCDQGYSFRDSKGLSLTVFDIDSKKYKNPIVLKCTNGKEYVASVDYVNFMVMKNQPAVK